MTAPPPPADAAAVRIPGTGFVRDRSTQVKEVAFVGVLLFMLGLALLTLIVLLVDIFIDGQAALAHRS